MADLSSISRPSSSFFDSTSSGTCAIRSSIHALRSASLSSFGATKSISIPTVVDGVRLPFSMPFSAGRHE
ncbi:MAG: hypothetical protein J6T94_08545 [Bacteroidaceae bacterium]|nr:hypothetical protein [Bacteroidaceae bacterium]